MQWEKPRITAPYPGLRPFESFEAPIFFGRGIQVDDMIQRLENHRFLAVIGASGCGKSSLVRAGLLPALDAGELFEAGDNWQTVIVRPGRSPFHNLAAAWCESLQRADAASGLSPEEDGPADLPAPADTHFTEAVLRGGPLGLVEAIEDARIDSETNVLLLIDQFEELFRFRYQDQDGDHDEHQASAEHSRDEANAFVNLLLVTARQLRRQNVYVVLTMRSDFLGDCDAFQDLPAAINDSQFLTPRMTSQQIRQAILGPLQAFDADAEPELIGRVLRDIGSERDELPLLQHALMRVWTETRSKFQVSSSELPSSDNQEAATLTLKLSVYERIGGLAQALSDHADEAYEELETRKNKRVAEMMFRCLCDQGGEQRLTRRLVTVGEVAAIAGVEPEQVHEVAEVFRSAGRCFLMPAEADKPLPEQTLDISHEALIRQWDLLGKWIEAEEESAGIYRRLAETAEQHRAGTAGLYRSPELDIALAWREAEHPTAAWAKRYHEDLAGSLEFLDRSEEAQQRRTGLAVFSFAVVACLALVALWMWQRAEGLTVKARKEKAKADVARADALDKKKAADAASARATTALGDAKHLLSRIAWEQERDPIKSTFYLYLAAQDYAQAGDALETGMHLRARERSHFGPERSFPSNGPVRGAKLVSEGARLLTWSEDGTARLWDVEQGQELKQFKHDNWVYGAELVADGTRLLTWSDDGTARLWDVEQGQELKQFKHESGVVGAELVSDGARLLTWSKDGTARLWDTDTSVPLDRRILEWQVQTATKMDESGEITVLRYDEWQPLRQELSDTYGGFSDAK